MKVDIRCRGLEPSEALLSHISHRAQLQLDRFQHEIDEVRVRLDDVNGPKGGVDTRCQVTVRGPRIGAMSVEQLDTAPNPAAGVALKRIARVMARRIERRHRSSSDKVSIRRAA